MNTTIRFALLSAAIVTLSACAPMTTTPVPDNTYTPPVTEPDPVPPVADPDPSMPQQQYVVQLTASSSQMKAEGIKNAFAARGYNAFVSPLMVNGRLLYRVQIGYYNNQADAAATLQHMRQQFPGDVYVADAIVKTP
ncbi:MAG: SPOR domain-containing protein [Thiolinea sp.]